MSGERKNPYQRARRGPDKGGTDKGAGRRGLRRLPSDLEALASGEVDRLRRPRRAPAGLRDQREGHVVPGVRNLEARAVYDAEVARLRQALREGRTDALAEGLCTVRRAALWRARNVVDFAAFAHGVLGIEPEQAQAWAAQGATRLGVTLDPLPHELVALFIRASAAASSVDQGSRVRLGGSADAPLLVLSLAAREVDQAVTALTSVSDAVKGLRGYLRR